MVDNTDDQLSYVNQEKADKEEDDQIKPDQQEIVDEVGNAIDAALEIIDRVLLYSSPTASLTFTILALAILLAFFAPCAKMSLTSSILLR